MIPHRHYIELQKLQNVFSTQLNLNINLSVFLFRTQLGTSEPVKDWQALTTSMLFVFIHNEWQVFLSYVRPFASVTLVQPTQRVELFSNIFTPPNKD